MNSQKESLPVSIIHQNEDVLVVNKPAGLSVHNNEDSQNLLKILEKQMGFQKLLPVHRLDKETSGVQILAFHSKAAATWAKQFEDRLTTKLYFGVLKGPLKTNEGLWNRALSDKAEGRKNPQGQSKDRVPCETKFKVLETNKYFTLCEFLLITGRQHQIRKHAALEGHPLIGDPRYGTPKYNEKIAQIYNQNRMFLHCGDVQILSSTFKADVPIEFDELLK